MARKPRVHAKGFTQHIIQRGRNREACFFADADYQYYLQVLAQAAEESGCDVHAYVLMTNHVHLLVTPSVDQGISLLMKSLGQRYTQYINYTYRRTGSVWEGRYKASVIDTERYLLTCYRYIELNPVRAGMTMLPSEYRWSSARWHGFAEMNSVINDHPLYLALGQDVEQRTGAYRQLFKVALDDDVLDKLGVVFNQEKVLGDSHFAEQIRQAVENKAGSDPLGLTP